jgi:thioredoxin reductase
MPLTNYDVIVVGAGPAGLSAALVLGRCRRSVLLLDAGEPRNARARAIHGYLTREGIGPDEFRRLARRELAEYSTVALEENEVLAARGADGGFEVTLRSGGARQARKLLLATGVVDQIPDIKGIDAFYGTSVHHCPYCDAWEVRDQALAVYGNGPGVASLAMTLRTWSTQLLVCTDGAAEFDEADRTMLARHAIPVREDRVRELVGHGHALERVIFQSGKPFDCRALFFSTGQRQRSSIAADLGCEFSDKGTVLTGRCETTNVPGVFVAGDASKATQFVIVAAAEGAEAACEINRSLEEADRVPT